MTEPATKEWLEGRQAWLSGVAEADCPYHYAFEWEKWADWICGRGEAEHEDWLKATELAPAAS